MTAYQQSPRRRWPWILLTILLVLAAGIGIGFVVVYWNSGHTQLPGIRTETPTIPASQQTEPLSTQTTVPLVDNPIDFAALQEINTDIYAYIYIPDTEVDYPVAQSTDREDDFYLEHNIYKEYEFAGTVYSQKQNSLDFSDRHTVLYGHNMLNGTMFATLHYFRDEDFFDSHPNFYIYTPGHILTYTIFAAYEYDDRHLLNTFDLADDEVWAAYLVEAQNPKSMAAITRPETEVTTDDTIVTLSTCVGSNDHKRYLVQGVLTDDQPTK